MAIYHHTTRMIGRSNGGSPVKALAYISGSQLSDERTGEVWDFKDKSVDDIRILLPDNAPAWAKEIQKLISEDKEPDDQDLNNRDKGLQLLSDIANRAEKRGDAQVYREIEFSLPRELTSNQNRKLAGEYVQDQFCGMGMLAIQSFHTEICEKTGELNPHCHTFFLTRELTEDGLSAMKNRNWNQKSVHEVWREQWASYASFHLKLHGHNITLDHRSYKDQGLDIEPQVKLGKGVNEQEKRAKAKDSSGEKNTDHGNKHHQGLDLCSVEDFNSEEKFIQGPSRGLGFVENIPATDRVQELRSIQLRNLYRIIRRPETVLDIVTRHHATFMWGDVQKILGRYVDEPEIFQRLDARLRNSAELLLLKMEGVRNHTGGIEDMAIYTTRSMLKAEKALVDTAEILAASSTHGVSSNDLEAGLERIQNTLEKEGPGYSLSEDQEKAIRHLVDKGQLKCIVGYAGAGKTTALEVCRDIWERDGYKVYGLAPTGGAAQNLEQGGISSMTLHKFLKSFEEGRCQYGEKSVLVLDEAGMVDVERFDKFLGAVQTLGVKAVVVGDGAQLQPVEAGPAFRLVTTRVGVSRLEHVVRQKESWQREATVLFGKQESKAAIQSYQEKGHIHLQQEPLTKGVHVEETLRRYEISARTSGLIFREIMKEFKAEDENYFEKNNRSHPPSKNQGRSRSLSQYGENNQTQRVSQHQDYPQFLKWKEVQKDAAREILGNADVYREDLEKRGLDPLEMARLFVDKKQGKTSQYSQAADLLKTKKLDHLIGVERVPGYSVEVRSAAKAALIEDWKQAYHENAQKTLLEGTLLEGNLLEGSPVRGSLLMMAYNNRDVRDLNNQARSLLKASGVLDRQDFTYTITREVEDDFGRRTRIKESRDFSKGDRIVFTRNKRSFDKGDLGVKNGSMGTIVSLNKNSIEVALDNKGTSDKDRTLTFSPHLFSFFDQGWAVTIHKSQGTTVDKSFLLASHEMNQNLTYVAMTRHREEVHVYGSTLDFWRPEKVSEVLSKSGEKLGAADYLDAKSLSLLMRDEDKFLDRLFTRLSDELHAMGAVSKRAFGMVADHFLGRALNDKSFNDVQDPLRRPLLLNPESLIKRTIREEDRAHDIMQKKPEERENKPVMEESPLESFIENSLERHTVDIHSLQGNLTQLKLKKNHTLQDVYEEWKHPAFKNADFYKRVFEEGLKLHGDHTHVNQTRVDHTGMDNTSLQAEAIEYWNARRETFIELYGRKLQTVSEELASPLLSYMSEESRKLAQSCAIEDPDRVLEFLDSVKSSKQADQDASQLQQGNLKGVKSSPPYAPTLQGKQAENEVLDEFFTGYSKFKELLYRVEHSPDNHELQKELHKIGKTLFKNKEMFIQLERIDPEMSTLIKQQATMKMKEISIEETRAREKVLELDRGGFSI